MRKRTSDGDGRSILVEEGARRGRGAENEEEGGGPVMSVQLEVGCYWHLSAKISCADWAPEPWHVFERRRACCGAVREAYGGNVAPWEILGRIPTDEMR